MGLTIAEQMRGLERVEGIEPSPKAWEAFVLPLNYTREAIRNLAKTEGADNRGVGLAPVLD